MGSEGTVLLDIVAIRISRGISAELDETDETSGSETLPTVAVKSGAMAEL